MNSGCRIGLLHRQRRVEYSRECCRCGTLEVAERALRRHSQGQSRYCLFSTVWSVQQSGCLRREPVPAQPYVRSIRPSVNGERVDIWAERTATRLRTRRVTSRPCEASDSMTPSRTVSATRAAPSTWSFGQLDLVRTICPHGMRSAHDAVEVGGQRAHLCVGAEFDYQAAGPLLAVVGYALNGEKRRF